MNDKEQEGMRNRVIDFFKRTDNEYRDAKQPAIIDEDFVAPTGFDLFAVWLDEKVVDTPQFEFVSGMLILVAAVITGMQVQWSDYYDENPQDPVNQLDTVIIYLFCIECLIRISGEGRKPWRYFLGDTFLPPLNHPSLAAGVPGAGPSWASGLCLRLGASTWDTRAKWNCFDFTISYSSLLFSYSNLGVGTGATGVIKTFRLLRAVRLLSLMQRFEELKVCMHNPPLFPSSRARAGGVGSISTRLGIFFEAASCTCNR